MNTRTLLALSILVLVCLITGSAAAPSLPLLRGKPHKRFSLTQATGANSGLKQVWSQRVSGEFLANSV